MRVCGCDPQLMSLCSFALERAVAIRVGDGHVEAADGDASALDAPANPRE
jgi:hypothetical protein